MKDWNDYIRREDLENESGEVDMDKVRALSLNTYLRYIGDLIEMSRHEYPDVASDQVEEFMTDDFMTVTHVLEGRYPEPKEIEDYLRTPENVEARQYWTYICVHANRENWPELQKMIRERFGIPEDVKIKNEELRLKEMEKAARERNWKFKEL